MENSMEVPQKLKIELPYDPTITPGHMSGKTTIQKYKGKPVSISALFMITKTSK